MTPKKKLKTSCAFCAHRDGKYLLSRNTKIEKGKWRNITFIQCTKYGEMNINAYISCRDYIKLQPYKTIVEKIEPDPEGVARYMSVADKCWI